MFLSVTFASFHGATVSYSLNLELDSQVANPSDRLVSYPHRAGVKVPMVGFFFFFNMSSEALGSVIQACLVWTLTVYDISPALEKYHFITYLFFLEKIHSCLLLLF